MRPFSAGVDVYNTITLSARELSLDVRIWHLNMVLALKKIPYLKWAWTHNIAIQTKLTGDIYEDFQLKKTHFCLYKKYFSAVRVHLYTWARILVQVTIYRRLLIGRDGHRSLRYIVTCTRIRTLAGMSGVMICRRRADMPSQQTQHVDPMLI